MKMNPKIAKTVDDLKGLEFKKMKALIKKDLARLEKNTTAEKPTQIIMSGEFPYKDKPTGIGFMLLGAWKGTFKTYAKNDIGKNDQLGAIGQAYYGGVGDDGQKVIRIDLAKGKAKGKTDKLKRSLKKLVPQATFNLVFGEMSEKALDGLEQKLDAQPEVEEVFEEPDMSDAGDVEVHSDQDIQKLLDSNLAELTGLVTTIKSAVYPRLKARTPEDGDADTVVDTMDLANEWMEMYKEASDDIRAKNSLKWAKVLNIIEQVKPMLPLLEGMGITATAAQPNKDGKTPQYAAVTKALDIGKELGTKPMYWNGYAGPDGYWCPPDYTKKIEPGQKIPDGIKQPTWCNAFARDVVTQAIGKENNPLGTEFESWMKAKHPGAGKLGSAGAMLEYFEEKAAAGQTVEEIPLADIEKAWVHINAGKIVFFSHPKHIAIGAPSTPAPWKLSTGKTINIGKIIQAGVTSNIGVPVAMNQGFGEDRLPDLKIFVSKKNGEATGGGNTLKPEQIKLEYKGGAAPMNGKAEAILRDILAKANEPNAAIVNTLRSNAQQASVMYLNLESAGVKVNRKMYKDKAAAGKVIDAYEKAKAAGKGKEEIIGAMLAVGGFDKISEHCDSSNPAIDIHPASIKNKSNFEAVIKADARVSVICPPKDTTYHIKVK